MPSICQSVSNTEVIQVWCLWDLGSQTIISHHRPTQTVLNSSIIKECFTYLNFNADSGCWVIRHIPHITQIWHHQCRQCCWVYCTVINIPTFSLCWKNIPLTHFRDFSIFLLKHYILLKHLCRNKDHLCENACKLLECLFIIFKLYHNTNCVFLYWVRTNSRNRNQQN